MLKTDRNMKKAPSTLMSSTSLSDLGVAGRPLSSIPPLALEQRYMFDAAGVAVGAEAAQESLAEKQAEAEGERLAEALARDAEKSRQEREQEAAERAGPSGSIIVFIDRSVEGYESLVAGLDPDVEVFYFNTDKNGLSQMAMALEGRRDIAAVHIISHGGVGELRLGDGLLTLENLGENKEALAAIRASLGDDADILLYGCNVGAGGEGRAFVEALAEALDADVAASDDLTGAQGWDGDWELETEIGAIETDVLFSEETREAFKGVLVNDHAPKFMEEGTAGIRTSTQGKGEHKLIVGKTTIDYGTNENKMLGRNNPKYKDQNANYAHKLVLTIIGIKDTENEKFKIHRSNEFLNAATIDLVDNASKTLINEGGDAVFTYKVEKVGNSWRITFTPEQQSGIAASNLLRGFYYVYEGDEAIKDGKRTFQFAITDRDGTANDPGITQTNTDLAKAEITIDSKSETITGITASIEKSDAYTEKRKLGVGDQVQITVTADNTLGFGSTLTVKLNSGATVNLTRPHKDHGDVKTYVGTYTVESGHNADNLKIIEITGGQDNAGNALLVPKDFLKDGKNNLSDLNIKVETDTKAPTMDDAKTDKTYYKQGDEMKVTLTFDEKMKEAGTGQSGGEEAIIEVKGLGKANGIYVKISNTEAGKLIFKGFNPFATGGPDEVDTNKPVYMMEKQNGEKWYIWAREGSGYHISRANATDATWYWEASQQSTFASSPEDVKAWFDKTGLAGPPNIQQGASNIQQGASLEGKKGIALKIDKGYVLATFDQFVAGSDNKKAVYKVALPANIEDTDGIEIKAISGLTDEAGNALTSPTTEKDVGGTDPHIDTKVPTVEAITVSVGGGGKIGSTATITIAVSEEIKSGKLKVKLKNGQWVTGFKLSVDKKSYTGTYTLKEGDTAANLKVATVALDASNEAKDAAGNKLSTDLTGVTHTLPTESSLDTTRPKIDGVSNKSIAWKNDDDDLTLRIKFSEPVTLEKGKTATIKLDIGGVEVTATATGTGVKADTLDFVIAFGDLENKNDLNGIDIKANSLSFAAGALVDEAGNDASKKFVIPDSDDKKPGVQQGLYRIDTTHETITGIETKIKKSGASGFTSPGQKETLGVGDQVQITVKASYTVGNGSTLTVKLNSGATLTLTRGSDNKSYVGTYTVKSGDNADILKIIEITGGQDNARNALITTIPSGSDLSNLNIKVETIDIKAPTIDQKATKAAASWHKAGDKLQIELTFDEEVTLSGEKPTLTLNIGGKTVTATTDGVLSNKDKTLTFTTDEALASGLDLTKVEITSISLNGGALKDTSNNEFDVSKFKAFDVNAKIDTIVPSIEKIEAVDGTYKAGGKVDITVTVSEDMPGGSQITVTLNTGGTVTLTRDATDKKKFTGVYTVGANHYTDDLKVTNVALVTSKAAKDAAGNELSTDLTGTLGDLGNVVIDGKAPIIDGDPAVKPEWHRAGNELQINLTFNENVKLSGGAGGNPALKLDLGGVTVYATYASGSGGKTLVFKTKIPAGKDIDVTGIDIIGYNLNSATLKDDAGNEFDASGLTGLKVAANIDTIAPKLESDSVVNPTALNTVTAGEDLQIKVKFTETVTLTGTATIQVKIGGKLVTATAAAQSGSNTLTFTVAAADLEGLKGEVTVQGGSITLTSGSLVKDKAGNAVASLALTKTALTNQTVDATVPEEPTDDEIETIEDTETGVPVVKTIDAPKETDITEVSLVVKDAQEGVFFIKGEQIDEGESRLTVNGVNLKVQLKDGKLSLSRTDGGKLTPEEVKNIVEGLSFKTETPGKHGIDIVYLRGTEGSRDQVGPPILARFEITPPPVVVVPTSPSPGATDPSQSGRNQQRGAQRSQRTAVTRPELTPGGESGGGGGRTTPTRERTILADVDVTTPSSVIMEETIGDIRETSITPEQLNAPGIQKAISEIRNERMTNVAEATAIRARSLISSAFEPVFTREVSPSIEGGAESASPREELVINRPEARGAEEAPEQAAPTPETQPEREGLPSIELLEETPVPAEQAEQAEEEQSSLDQPEGGFRESLRLAGRGESIHETKLAKAMAEHRPADLA